MRDFHDDNRTERWMEACSVAELRAETDARWAEGFATPPTPSPRCIHCNLIHDTSALAKAMCEAGSRLLDEEHRSGMPRRDRLSTLRIAYDIAYTAWRAEAV